MVEMEVLDVQVPEQGNLNFFFETKHNEAMERNEDFLAILFRFKYDLKD